MCRDMTVEVRGQPWGDGSFFYVGVRDQTHSGGWACVVNVLPTEPALQPPPYLCLKHCLNLHDGSLLP